MAVEQLRVATRAAGIADQDDHGLAVNIESGVIVPAILGRDDAEADEHQFAVRNRHFGVEPLGPKHHVLLVDERARRAMPRYACRGVGAGAQLDHGNRLHKAVAVARLEAQLAQARSHEGNRLVLTRSARQPSLEVVRGQHADVGAQHVLVDIGGRRRRTPAARTARKRGQQQAADAGPEQPGAQPSTHGGAPQFTRRAASRTETCPPDRRA